MEDGDLDGSDTAQLGSMERAGDSNFFFFFFFFFSRRVERRKKSVSIAYWYRRGVVTVLVMGRSFYVLFFGWDRRDVGVGTAGTQEISRQRSGTQEHDHSMQREPHALLRPWCRGRAKEKPTQAGGGKRETATQQAFPFSATREEPSEVDAEQAAEERRRPDEPGKRDRWRKKGDEERENEKRKEDDGG